MVVKRGHVVSKGYLRAWADARNIVEVIDTQDKRAYLTSIENATVVSYAYDPAVLTRDLEGDYARIETDGIPVIRKLHEGQESLTYDEQRAMITFLDMHLERGRYADQHKVLIPASLMLDGGVLKDAELNLGDRLLLAQSVRDIIRLAPLGLENRPWHVLHAHQLATGDGAVLLWASSTGAEICTVTFPLSPTRLLVIGDDLPERFLAVPVLNQMIAERSRRWLIGERGRLNLSFAEEGTTRPAR